jgi:hypothetical protein
MSASRPGGNLPTREEALRAIDLVEAIRFLTCWLDEEIIRGTARLRRESANAGPSRLTAIRDAARHDLESIRHDTGCLLSDAEILRAKKWLTSPGNAFVSLPKFWINKGFTNFPAVFARWPHIPLHARVVFDTDLTKPSRQAILLAEQELFRDVRLSWDKAQELARGGQTFKTRNPERQRDLQSYLRLAVSSVYQCLEAYLNGIAFECFQSFHHTLPIDEHDLLAEWDSRKRKRRFVAFETKVFRYPSLYGRYLGRPVDLRDDADARFLVGDGKSLRDSLTHMSPKFTRLTNINIDEVRAILESAVGYMLSVERELGRDPSKSAPWLTPLT